MRCGNTFVLAVVPLGFEPTARRPPSNASEDRSAEGSKSLPYLVPIQIHRAPILVLAMTPNFSPRLRISITAHRCITGGNMALGQGRLKMVGFAEPRVPHGVSPPEHALEPATPIQVSAA